jgi:hypothetical protein
LKDTHGVSLWLTADTLAPTDGSGVATWSDSSPAGHDMTQDAAYREPTLHLNQINGLPVVRFDGVAGEEDFLARNQVTLPKGLTYAVVFRTKSTASGAGSFEGITPALPILADRSDNIQNGLGVDGGKGSFNSYVGPGSAVAAGKSTVNDGAVHFMIATHDTSSGAMKLYVDGTLEGTAEDSNYHALTGYSAIGSGFGASPTTDANKLYFQGDVAEVLAYDRVLSAEELPELEKYLVARYMPERAAGETAGKKKTEDSK